MESATASNKENTKPSGSLKSYFKTSKNGRSAIPTPVGKQKNSSTSGKKTKARPAPDFSKIHNSWKSKLESGKALSKKPCTVSTEFDLTKPGSQFTRVPERELCFQETENQEPVCSNLSSRCEAILEENQANEHNVNTPSKGVKRRVLGEITSTELNSPNKSPRTNSKQKHFTQEQKHFTQEQKHFTQEQKHFTQEQKHFTQEHLSSDPAVEFESDDKSLDSILMDKGISVSNMYTPGRMTQLPPQSTRPSIMSQRTPRFSMRELNPGRTLEAIPIRNSIYISYKPRLTAQPETPKENNTAPRTFLHARRVLNPQFSACKSPAVRVNSPMCQTLPKKPHTDLPAQSRHRCKWSDVLASPLSVNQRTLARNLEYEDENEIKEVLPERTQPLRAIPDLVENQTSAQRQAETQMVNLEPPMSKHSEVITGSKCQGDKSPRLHSAMQLNSHNSSMSDILQNSDNKENIIAETLFPDVQKFISKNIKHRRRSAAQLHESLSESQSFLGKLNNCKTIVGELSRVEQLKEQLALAEKSLRDQLKFAKDVENRNLTPVLTSLPSDENSSINNSVKTENERHLLLKFFEEPKINISSIQAHQEKQLMPKILQEPTSTACEENDFLVPLDLSVKSNLIKENINNVVEQTPDKNPYIKTCENPDKLQLHLTPFITKKVGDLKLTETTTVSCNSKEPTQSCNLNIANTETKTLDIEGSDSTSKSPCFFTPSAQKGNTSAFNRRDNHMKISSPIAEKLNSQSTCNVLGENCDYLRPPIWTPLALKSLGAISSPHPGDVEPEVLSHGASMVVDPSRCQSNDDSHSPLSSTGPLPSASCINQSADSEDGEIGRHLALCGSSMTQTPCLSSSDNTAAILPTYLFSPTLHKSGQDSVQGHNLTHLAKDGHNDLSHTQDNFFDCASTHRPMPTALSAIVPVQTDCQHFFLREQIFSTESATTNCQPRTFQGHPEQLEDKANSLSRTAQREQSESPKPASSGTSSSQRRASGSRRDNVRVDSRHHLTPPHGEVGSLSLRGNVLQGRKPAARVSPNVQSHRRFASRLQDSQQLFLETLLDEECALFTCCRSLSFISDSTSRCPNPVAQVLSQGDEMHFLPISDDYHGEHGHLEGSAFGSYTPVHTRSVTRPN